MSKRTLYIAVFFIVVIALSAFTWWFHSTQTLNYRNDQYGFIFALPQDWKGYTILEQTWTGTSHCSSSPTGFCTTDSGPEIVIRNPNWTADQPLQDIPILVFTLDQWNEVQQWTFSVSAAGVPPLELGSNSQYVFALPPQYDMAALEGGKEVDDILRSNLLSTYQPTETSSGTTDYKADEAAIASFMGDNAYQTTFVSAQHPSNFMVAQTTEIGGGGGFVANTPKEWERTVNVYQSVKTIANTCQVYRFEVYPKTHEVVNVGVVYPQGYNGTCNAKGDLMTPIVAAAQVRTTGDNIMQKALGAQYASLKSQIKVTSVGKDGGSDRVEWLYQDTSFKAPAGLTAEPKYPEVLFYVANSGALLQYNNTLPLFSDE